MPSAKVIAFYDGSEDNSLSLKPGKKVKIVSEHDDWVWIECDGKSGYYPRDHLRVEAVVKSVKDRVKSLKANDKVMQKESDIRRFSKKNGGCSQSCNACVTTMKFKWDTSTKKQKMIFGGTSFLVLLLIIILAATVGKADEEIASLSQAERLSIAEASLADALSAIGLNPDEYSSNSTTSGCGSWTIDVSTFESAGISVGDMMDFLGVDGSISFDNMCYLGSSTSDLPYIFSSGDYFKPPGWVLDTVHEPVPFAGYSCDINVSGSVHAVTLLIGVADIADPLSVEMAAAFELNLATLEEIIGLSDYASLATTWLNTLDVTEDNLAIAATSAAFYLDNGVYIGEGVTAHFEAVGAVDFESWGFFVDLSGVVDCDDYGTDPFKLACYLPIPDGVVDWMAGYYDLTLPNVCYDIDTPVSSSKMEAKELTISLIDPEAVTVDQFTTDVTLDFGDEMQLDFWFSGEFVAGELDAEIFLHSGTFLALEDYQAIDLQDVSGNYIAAGNILATIGDDDWTIHELSFESTGSLAVGDFNLSASLLVFSDGTNGAFVTSANVAVPYSLQDLICLLFEYCDEIPIISDFDIPADLTLTFMACSATMVYDADYNFCLEGLTFSASAPVTIPDEFQDVFAYFGFEPDMLEVGVQVPITTDFQSSLLTNVLLQFTAVSPSIYTCLHETTDFTSEGENQPPPGMVELRMTCLAVELLTATPSTAISAILDVIPDDKNHLIFIIEAAFDVESDLTVEGYQVGDDWVDVFGIKGFTASGLVVGVTFRLATGTMSGFALAGSFDMGSTLIEFAFVIGEQSSQTEQGIYANVVDLSLGDVLNFAGTLAEQDFTDIAQAADDAGLFHIHNLKIEIGTNYFSWQDYVFRAGFFINGTVTFLGTELFIEAGLGIREDTEYYQPDFYVTLLLTDFSLLKPVTTILDVVAWITDLINDAATICVPGWDEACYTVDTGSITDELNAVSDYLNELIYFNELGVDEFSLYDLIAGNDAGSLVYDLVVLDMTFAGEVEISPSLFTDTGVDEFFTEIVAPQFDHMIDFVLNDWCDAFSVDLCVSDLGWECCVSVSGCPSATCEDPTDELVDALEDIWGVVTDVVEDVTDVLNDVFDPGGW